MRAWVPARCAVGHTSNVILARQRTQDHHGSHIVMNNDSPPGRERDWASGLVFVVLAANLLVNEAFPGAHVVAGLGLVAWLVGIARAGGLTAADLGLARSTWLAGLRCGAVAAALVGAGYALTFLITPVREALHGGDNSLGRAALTAVLVLIPLATGVPAGHGHTYTREYVDGWATVLQPAGLTPDQADRLRDIISTSEYRPGRPS